MYINDLIAVFASCFEQTDSSIFSPSTEFQDLDEWSSLTATILVAKIESAFGVELETEDIRECDTLQELFDVVKNYMQ